MIAVITRSTKVNQSIDSRNKKYTAFVFDKHARYKVIHFGAKSYSDYTIHKDKVRKNNYIKRHSAMCTSTSRVPTQDWNDPNTAGFWSRWLLWNKETLEDSAREIEKRFGLDVYLSFINQ